MADRLVELQEDIRKQERQVMFGRIAAGLVHDLSHPIQNIGNSCKLIMKMWDDAEYRETFRRMVEREMVIVKRVLDDLRNIARPIPLERFPVDLNRSVADAVEAMQQHAETAGLTLRAELSDEPLFIEGDVFALGRVYRNLILNAIQATAPGGLVVAATRGDRRSRAGARSTTPAAAFPPDRLQRDLRGLRHHQAARPRPRPRDLARRSSSSSAERSPSPARSARARRSCSTSRARARGRLRWSPGERLRADGEASKGCER